MSLNLHSNRRLLPGLAPPSLMLLALALCLPSARLGAQVLYGSLTGNVTDASGAAVPGAKIEAANTATGVVRQTTSDERGVYFFNDLQTGTYNVTVSAGSFRTVVQQGLSLNANTVSRLDTRMEISQVTESVTVSAAALALQTDRADVSAQLAKAQMTNLPIGSGRNFQSLYKLIPGFSPPSELHSDAGNPQRAMGANVNGASYSNNNTRLDGATVSYPWLPHIVAYVPPADAIETVNIVTNSFDAEQGMAGGSAINVSIKSGTNEFHGSAHEFHNNSRMKARNYFYCLYSCSGDPNQPPKNILNQFGGTFGGPIVKNKLFVFTDWERTTRRTAAAAFRTIPNDLLKQGDFTGSGAAIFDPLTGNPNGTGRSLFPNSRIPSSRFDPAAVIMTGKLPTPNQTAFPNNYLATGTYEFNRDNFDVKVNYNPTDKSSMFGRYSISPSRIFDPPSLGAAGGDALAGGQPGLAPGRVQSASVGGTYTLTPRVLLDANVGFTRQRLGAQNIDIDKNYGLEELKIPGTNGPDRLQGGYPRLLISGFSSVGNPNPSNPFLFRDNQYVAAGNLGWMKGAHSFRFGAEYSYYTINHFQPQAAFGPRGGFSFTGGLTALNGGAAPTLYNGWADWMLGLAQGLGKDLQYVNPAAVRMPSFGFYARDQWQVTRKLTLNYGVRYEYYPFATRDHRGGERYDPITDKVYIGGVGGVPTNVGVDVGKGQLAPRIGLAYRLNEKTVLRAGYGISVDPNSFRYMRDAYPAAISTQYSGATTFQAAGTMRTGIPEIAGPDISKGTIDLPKAVGTQTWPTVYNRGYLQSFNFTVQREIPAGFNVQASYVGTRAIRQTANININAAQGVGGGNNIRALFPQWGRIANINMMAPFNTASYNALQTQLNRRLNPDAQIGLAYTFSKALGYADNNDSGLSWPWPAMWQRNRAPANFDRAHNLQIFGIYDLPFGKGKKWAATGLPSLLAGGWQINGILSRMSGAPFTVGTAGTSVNSPGNTQTADQVVAKVTILGGHGRNDSYFDPMAFMPVTAVRFGNAGRNILRGPGFFNLDTSLFRNFRITERFRLQFRAEAFGVTNTPQFGTPGATASGATRNADNSIRALNGYTEILGASGERQLRFALKLYF
ncbi:MAG: TonB-dependent receptor [Candidatus Solibacter usitatus]|nr:TonB-dependent receptor [Candidatus Solibacter usitatus]